MRAYLTQWMQAAWRGPEINLLREELKQATTSAAITTWLHHAVEAGIDPL